jgi:hypothetical protein
MINEAAEQAGGIKRACRVFLQRNIDESKDTMSYNHRVSWFCTKKMDTFCNTNLEYDIRAFLYSNNSEQASSSSRLFGL